MLQLLLIFLLGISIGIIVTKFMCHKKAVDELLVDTSDTEDGPYMFLNLKHTPAEMMSKKYVTLKVTITDLLSHK